MKRKMGRSPQIVERDNEAALYERIRELVVNARRTVARGIDLVQVHTNFEIGRHVVAHEQQGKTRATYGKEVLKRLAEKLTAEFGRGFSKSNLEYMRRFFLAYQERMPIAQSETGQSMTVLRNEAEIAQSQTGQLAAVTSKAQPFRLSWTHYVFLLGIKNPDERSFYEIESSDQKTITLIVVARITRASRLRLDAEVSDRFLPARYTSVMTDSIRAIYENGVFRPLDTPNLPEHQQVRLTVESIEPSTKGPTETDRADPLADVRVSTGISDLAEHFDDYRFGRRYP